MLQKTQTSPRSSVRWLHLARVKPSRRLQLPVSARLSDRPAAAQTLIPPRIRMGEIFFLNLCFTVVGRGNLSVKTEAFFIAGCKRDYSWCNAGYCERVVTSARTFSAQRSKLVFVQSQQILQSSTVSRNDWTHVTREDPRVLNCDTAVVVQITDSDFSKVT